MVGFESRRRSRCRQRGGMVSFMIPWREARVPKLAIMKDMLTMPHSNAWINLQISMFIDLFGEERFPVSQFRMQKDCAVCSDRKTVKPVLESQNLKLVIVLQNMTLWKIKNLCFYVL
ncbi:hypothetical protein AVEN_104411-1 [Araneus ventricosus]|uniref:Uncharacterized protein n=1 Tax=Araneus ventricosus TaxID=182803 RepID=A0A4Y2N3N2_ARAVE|nr:hypothetical protein AVEN_104411-1 [Araneus ventricosus]